MVEEIVEMWHLDNINLGSCEWGKPCFETGYTKKKWDLAQRARSIRDTIMPMELGRVYHAKTPTDAKKIIRRFLLRLDRILELSNENKDAKAYVIIEQTVQDFITNLQMISTLPRPFKKLKNKYEYIKKTQNRISEQKEKNSLYP